jgi:hypothetical protein
MPSAATSLPPETPVPSTPVPSSLVFPPNIRPLSSSYEYKDNYGRQIVGIRVKNAAVQSEYTYYYNDVNTPENIVVKANPGYKFLFVGVTWDLLSVVGPGSRTFFMTPNTTSYKLIDAGDTYFPLYPFDIADPMHYYIKDQGTLVQEQRIDKDNPGTGILVFQVPDSMAKKDGYLKFCPISEPVWTILGYPHSPDNWDCTSNTISWRLV